MNGTTFAAYFSVACRSTRQPGVRMEVVGEPKLQVKVLCLI